LPEQDPPRCRVGRACLSQWLHPLAEFQQLPGCAWINLVQLDTSDGMAMHIYRGSSMRGTFYRGDRIHIEPVPLAAIRPGDVVAFRSANGPGQPQELVHRVIAVRAGGLATRGDNSQQADSELVTAKALIGRVIYFERDGKRLRTQGGGIGLLRARLLHTRLHVRNAALRSGRQPYRWLRRSALVPRLWRPQLTRLRVNTHRGPLVKYVSHGQTVARWWPAEGRFECRRPYDLVIPVPGGRRQVN
jgi:signal peptidase I